MIRQYNISPLINKSPEVFSNLIRDLVVVKVNDFNEAAAHKFSMEMTAAHYTGQEFIPILIDSYGGEAYSLISMLTDMERATLPIITVVEGKAMSCGAILLAMGDPGKRYAAPDATIMIHEAFGFGKGNPGDLEVAARELDRLNALIYSKMAKNGGVDKDYYHQLIHNNGHSDLYLNAKDAKRHKLVDHIKSPRITTTVDVKFTID